MRATLSALAGLLLFLGTSKGTTVEWALTTPLDLNLIGSSVTGSFSFDASIDTASTWSFELTFPAFPGGLSFTPATSKFERVAIFAGNDLQLGFVTDRAGTESSCIGQMPCPAGILDLLFRSPLTNAGGTVTV